MARRKAGRRPVRRQAGNALTSAGASPESAAPATPQVAIAPPATEAEVPAAALAKPEAEGEPQAGERNADGRLTPRDRVHAALWVSGLPNVLAIARREVIGLFVSPIFYVVAALLALLVTVFGYLPNLSNERPFTMGQIFALVETLMVFISPLLTMRLLAEERRAGTLEMLLTAPLRDWEVVAGKWLGGFGAYCAAVAFTLVFVVLMSVYEPLKAEMALFGHTYQIPALDYGSIWAGYAGLLFIGATWTAVGVLASSLTSNQIIAAMVGMFTLLVLHIGLSFSVQLPVPAGMRDALDYASAASHYASFNAGLITLRDSVYFLSLIAAALFLATRVLESRKWR